MSNICPAAYICSATSMHKHEACVCFQNAMNFFPLLQTIAQMVGDMEGADVVCRTCLAISALSVSP